MTSLEDLYSALQGLVVMITGIDAERAILANQGKPQPAGNTLYCTYNPIPVRAYGHPRRDRTLIPEIDPPADETGWTDIQEAQVSQIELMLSLNFYNEGAQDAAWKVHNAGFLPNVFAHLYSNNIGWRQAGAVRDLSAGHRGKVQKRFQLDVDLVVEGTQTCDVLAAALSIVKIYDEDDNEI